MRATRRARPDDTDRWILASAAREMDAPLSQLLAALRTGEHTSGRGSEHLQLAERLDTVVRALAGMSTSDAPILRATDMHEAIERALSLAWQHLASRARVNRHYRPIPRVQSHLPALTRIILALLRNAAEAIPTLLPIANAVSVETGVSEDGGVFVDVADTGVGIEENALQYIFEPFFTSKGAAAAGLGLAMARASVDWMGGTITVESVVGRGSRFRVTVPAAERTRGSALPGLQTESTPLRRVLVVAKSAKSALALGAMYDADGTIVVLADGEEALKRLGLGEPFELVLWDAEAWGPGGYRQRLEVIAPGAVARTFPLRPPPTSAKPQSAAE